MVRRMIAGVALASAAALAVTGCSSDDDRPKVAPEVAWAGKACGVLNQTAAVPLPKTRTANVAQSKASIVKLLGDISTRLRTLSMNVQSLGAPPVPGGKELHATAMSRLTSTSSAVSTAKLNLERAKVTDRGSLKQAVDQVGKAFKAYGEYRGPQQDFRSNPTLNSAFAQVPACRATGAGS
jgi:hypothetical protein